tara:strand:- start:3360 stop:3806 length:447 start_codon:yes stop_codon:yes gene_type:complete
MSVKENTDLAFVNVRIERNSFMMAAHFYDIIIGEGGIQGYYMWRNNDFRIPGYHHVVDYFKRIFRGRKKIESAVEKHEKNFHISFDDIQGVVTYRDHKEIQLLSVNEQIYFLFRKFEEYDLFVAYLEDKIGEKYFTRDNIDIKDSVYI